MEGLTHFYSRPKSLLSVESRRCISAEVKLVMVVSEGDLFQDSKRV